jgi:transcriptional regulator with XRE-family HTH domain
MMKKRSFVENSSKYLSEDTPNKNLKFLSEFMRQLGLSMEDVAVAAGVRTNSARNWFLVDNMSLSKVIKITEHFGYEFVISYDTPAPKIDRTKLVIEEPAETFPDIDMTKRLAFIRVAMYKTGVTNTLLAEKIGCIRGAVQKFFQTDDTSLSNIYRIAEAFDWTVNIRFKKKTV